MGHEPPRIQPLASGCRNPLLRIAAVGDNAAMLVDCVIALLASVLLLPLAWIKWTQWRQAGSKPFQFSLGRLFLAMTIFSLAAWSFTRTEPWEKGEWINGLGFLFFAAGALAGMQRAACIVVILIGVARIAAYFVFPGPYKY